MHASVSIGRLLDVPWPTWDQAAVLAVVSLLVASAARRWASDDVRRVVGPAAYELALMSMLYSLWRLARVLPLAHDEGAVERARQIVRLQTWLHLPSELSLQHFVLRHDAIAHVTNWYYAIAHVPALLVFLVWLFVRHRNVYPHWRNGLVFATAGCLIIRFVRVAPPRFLADLGYIDLASRYGMSLYGPVGTGVSDQFAAMPSIHVAWAAVVSFGTMAATTSRWRWVVLQHLVITMLVVSATGNHWWLDGIVALGLLAAGLALDTRFRMGATQAGDTASPNTIDPRSSNVSLPELP